MALRQRPNLLEFLPEKANVDTFTGVQDRWCRLAVVLTCDLVVREVAGDVRKRDRGERCLADPFEGGGGSSG